MKTLQHLKAQMLANPETCKAYHDFADEFGMACELIAARARSYTLEQVLAMQGDTPLVLDTDWDTMPATGREVAL